MRIEVTIAKTTVLPAGALDALAGELSRRIHNTFPDNAGAVTVRYAAANNLSVIGGAKKIKIASAKSCRKRGRALTTGSSQINTAPSLCFLPGRPGFFLPEIPESSK